MQQISRLSSTCLGSLLFGLQSPQPESYIGERDLHLCHGLCMVFRTVEIAIMGCLEHNNQIMKLYALDTLYTQGKARQDKTGQGKPRRTNKEKGRGRQPLLRSNSTRQPDRAHARTQARTHGTTRKYFPVGLTPQHPIYPPLCFTHLPQSKSFPAQSRVFVPDPWPRLVCWVASGGSHDKHCTHGQRPPIALKFPHGVPPPRDRFVSQPEHSFHNQKCRFTTKEIETWKHGRFTTQNPL